MRQVKVKKRIFSPFPPGENRRKGREGQRSAFSAMLLKTRAVALTKAETAPNTSPVIANAFCIAFCPAKFGFRRNLLSHGI